MVLAEAGATCPDKEDSSLGLSVGLYGGCCRLNPAYFPFFGAGFAGFFAAGFLVILATSFGDSLIAHLPTCALSIILIDEALSSGLPLSGVGVGGTE
jgi:hypothetical protein